MTRKVRTYTRSCQFSNWMSSSQFQCHRDVINDTKVRIGANTSRTAWRRGAGASAWVPSTRSRNRTTFVTRGSLSQNPGHSAQTAAAVGRRSERGNLPLRNGELSEGDRRNMADDALVAEMLDWHGSKAGPSHRRPSDSPAS